MNDLLNIAGGILYLVISIIVLPLLAVFYSFMGYWQTAKDLNLWIEHSGRHKMHKALQRISVRRQRAAGFQRMWHMPSLTPILKRSR